MSFRGITDGAQPGEAAQRMFPMLAGGEGLERYCGEKIKIRGGKKKKMQGREGRAAGRPSEWCMMMSHSVGHAIFYLNIVLCISDVANAYKHRKREKEAPPPLLPAAAGNTSRAS
ncbi:hypothetical protein TcCL_NonESM00202 [Trypanosoma cruzi]|nr:hypothetical protein TcCL_NonESM00202 [Trypanosoma cruzi]